MNAGSRFLRILSCWLKPLERDPILGDLLERQTSAWDALFEVAGYRLRRLTVASSETRTWGGALALAIPATFVLTAITLTLSRAYQAMLAAPLHQWTGLRVREGAALFLCNLIALLALLATGAFQGSPVRRRTVGISFALASLPCFLCMAHWDLECRARLCLLLSAIPAVSALLLGLRWTGPQRGSALVVALSMTAATIPAWFTPGAWLPNWALSWPAWYLVVASRRRS